MALTSFARGSLFGRRFGDGVPTVIALHGWGRRSEDFTAVLEGMNAIAFDLPGFGASPPPLEAIGARDYADALAPVLRELHSVPTVLGHSFGGRVGLCLAARHPDLVDRLVLTGVPLLRGPGAGRPSWTYRTVRLVHRLGLISDNRMEAYRRARGSADYRAASGVMRDVLVKTVNESYEPELAAVDCQVRLVWGSDDHDAPLGIAEQALVHLRESGVDAELDVVAGAGHFLPVEQPEVLRRYLFEGRAR